MIKRQSRECSPGFCVAHHNGNLLWGKNSLHNLGDDCRCGRCEFRRFEHGAVAISALAAACWAQVHGLALLGINGQLLEKKVGPDPVPATLDVLLDGVCCGEWSKPTHGAHGPEGSAASAGTMGRAMGSGSAPFF
ncbi:hypothetical protein AA0312_2719 [Acetobacter tropicalis NRIC 0312]|nr:hypothetical protein AA0312_2719 [Acetobacter tropicalis NRIC 0312]